MDNNFLLNREKRKTFLRQVEELWPIARGTLCEVRKPCVRKGCKACASGAKHPAHIYTYRENGKLYCRHVRPEFVGELKQALENGRELDRLTTRLGMELLEELRKAST
jgi:hypothetical protein